MNDLTPEQHYAEAQRLLRIAQQPILTGAPVGHSTHRDVVALAQLHATLALYRPPADDREEARP
ncbi:hypothetical protein ACFP2T_13550 [Plantactinospora solaniradicis]|uniref:Uncharacterized protein n=1 Tax=Plantactinospora solaniradicis TaxID=1723736 RepID=A0ABW1KA97_9ACTN